MNLNMVDSHRGIRDASRHNFFFSAGYAVRGLLEDGARELSDQFHLNDRSWEQVVLPTVSGPEFLLLGRQSTELTPQDWRKFYTRGGIPKFHT